MEHAFAAYRPEELRNIVDFLLHHTAMVRSVGEHAAPPPRPALSVVPPASPGHYSVAAE